MARTFGGMGVMGMPYGMLGNFNTDQQHSYANIPELSAQESAIANRQRIAQIMLFQGMQPPQEHRDANNNPIPISPFQALGGIAQMAVGAHMIGGSEKAMLDLANQRKQMIADEMAKIQGIESGTPAIPGHPMPVVGGGPVKPDTPAVPGNPDAAREAMIMSQFPQIQNLGNYRQKVADQIANREDMQTQAKDLRESQMETQKAIAAQASADRQLAARLGLEGRKLTIQMSGSPVDVIQDGKAVVINSRTGRVIGDSIKESPQQKRDNARTFSMRGIGASIQEADDILSGVKRDADGNVTPAPKPTGSGIGAAVDFAAGLVGKSPEGALEAQRLKAVGGALTSKMPRMEGPQSDKDTMLYKEMAAMVGDSTIPVDRRKAALETVKGLWGKYEHQNQETPSSPVDSLLEKYK